MPVAPHLLARRRRARVHMALAWLLVGSAALIVTPLDAWMPLVGWAPMLVLVVSPLVIAVALDPALPARLVVTLLARRGQLRASPGCCAWRATPVCRARH